MTPIIDFTSHPRDSFVATIGFFDGVHRGHLHLLEQVKQAAAMRGLPSMAITFAHHPRYVLSADYHPALLSTQEEKITRLRQAGIDACAVLDFDRAMAAMTSRDFMLHCLKEELGVSVLIIGYDHRFGCDRDSTPETYKRYGQEIGLEVLQATSFQLSGLSVSSSAVRRLLVQGNVERAADFLGYPYELEGEVVEGRHVGRTLGYPTANLRVLAPEKLLPASGAYAVKAEIKGGCTYGAMLDIGCRPTFGGGNISIESHLFDYSGNLYGHLMKLHFLHYIREERRFPSVLDLQEQLALDEARARQLLGS